MIEDWAAYLSALGQESAGPADRRALARLARQTLGPHLRRLGFKPKAREGDEDGLARAAVLSALSRLAPSSELAGRLRSGARAYLKDPAAVPPSLVSLVLNGAARRGGAELFEAYRRNLAAAATPEQKDQLLRALAEFRAPALRARYLDMTLSDEIRAQDAWKPYLFLLADPEAQAQTWGFLKENWPGLLAKLGPRGAARIISATGSLRADPAEVRQFFERPENRVELAHKALEQALESMELGERFRRAQRGALSEWLTRRNP